jgi:hypothetical protein
VVVLVVGVEGVLGCVELEGGDVVDEEVLLVVDVAAEEDALVVSPFGGVLVALDATRFCADPSAVVPLPVVPEPPPQAARISVVNRSEGKVRCFN